MRWRRGIAVGFGSVWAAVDGLNVIARIDLNTRRAPGVSERHTRIVPTSRAEGLVPKGNPSRGRHNPEVGTIGVVPTSALRRLPRTCSRARL